MWNGQKSVPLALAYSSFLGSMEINTGGTGSSPLTPQLGGSIFSNVGPLPAMSICASGF
jgi:hypothetical protein